MYFSCQLSLNLHFPLLFFCRSETMDNVTNLTPEESVSVSSSDDEDMTMLNLAAEKRIESIRRRRLPKRPSYTPPKKNSIQRTSLGRQMAADEEDRDSSSAETDSTTNEQTATTRRSRDLSPVESMRELLEEAPELLEDVLNRIAENVQNGADRATQIVKKTKTSVREGVHAVAQCIRDWKACHFTSLPGWMRDNEHLHFGHRPELKSFNECFKSIFRIHTETGNIWTHLIGFIAMTIVAIVFYVKPLCSNCAFDINLSEKLIFLTFFIGAILCLACSALFHTLSCHSENVSAIFSRLDYAGIAILTVGSSIPWIYYGFYCNFYTKLTYMIAVIILGLLTVVLTMWEKFNLPDYRVYRSIVFVTLGIVSGIPCFHHVLLNGIQLSIVEASFHCTVIMAALYLTGAILYAARIPERFMPGKCDIWFQSHQLFHLLVVAAAFVHYHGISEMAVFRLTHQCPNPIQPKVF